MSTLSVRNLQGISAYSNTILVPSSHSLKIDGGLQLPNYATSSLPATGTSGQIVYDSTTKTVKYWNTTTSSWSNIGSGGGTGTAGDPFSSSTYTVVSSGAYYFKVGSMATATQYYVDNSTSGGPWIRIFLANTDDYNTTSFSWVDTETPNLISSASRFMYCFVDPASNSTTSAWSWWFFDGTAASNYNAFRNNPPMQHGGVGAPLITRTNATQLSSSTNYNGYWLRTGISSFGNQCDDSRGGTWGQLCMKNSNSTSTDPGTGQGGLLDFPHYATYSYSGTDDCSQSNQGYTATKCSSSRRFAIYVKL